MEEYRLPADLTEVRILREARARLKSGKLTEEEALDLLERIEYAVFAVLPGRIERMRGYGKKAHIPPAELEKIEKDLQKCRTELLGLFPGILEKYIKKYM